MVVLVDLERVKLIVIGGGGEGKYYYLEKG